MVTENELSPKQVALIAALLTTGDVSKAAEAAGVARQTAYKWQKLPAFRNALREAEGQALRGLARRLTSLGDAAADALSDALDKDQPVGVRLRAADLVTARGPGLLEIAHFAERLEEIERRLSDREKINDGD